MRFFAVGLIAFGLLLMLSALNDRTLVDTVRDVLRGNILGKTSFQAPAPETQTVNPAVPGFTGNG